MHNEFQTVGTEILKARYLQLMFANGWHNKIKVDDRNALTGSYGLISSAKLDGEPVRCVLYVI